MSDKRKQDRPTPDEKSLDNIDRFLLPSSKSRDTQEVTIALRQVPLTLQPFFKDQIDLNKELVNRFPNMPLMSVVRFRDLYSDHTRGVATLSSQDGSASLIVDVSTDTEIQFSFMYGSMLALRFRLDELSELDRRTWLENMETRMDEIVFLWGQSRWAKDYIICVPHKYYLSLLAFSPNNFEAAVRMTPAISKELFAWLHKFWYSNVVKKDNSEKKDDSTSSILSSW